MTLVASFISRKWAIQVSDRRIVRSTDLGVLSDETSKAVLYWHQAAFAYSGLARIDEMRTDEWLTRLLAKEELIDDALELVRKEAEAAMGRLSSSVAVRNRRLAIHGVG